MLSSRFVTCHFFPTFFFRQVGRGVEDDDVTSFWFMSMQCLRSRSSSSGNFFVLYKRPWCFLYKRMLRRVFPNSPQNSTSRVNAENATAVRPEKKGKRRVPGGEKKTSSVTPGLCPEGLRVYVRRVLLRTGLCHPVETPEAVTIKAAAAAVTAVVITINKKSLREL